MKLVAKDFVGENAISMQSGKILYDKVSETLLVEKSEVSIDFDGVVLFASPFFNASIGLLLKDISIDELQMLLKIENLSQVGRQLLNHVIENAIDYYKMDAGEVEQMKAVIKDDDK